MRWLAIWLLLVGTAVASPLGAVYDVHPTDAATVQKDMDAMVALGLSWVRILPDWSSIQPTQDHYDWAWSDLLVRTAREHHLHVVYTLGYTPQWLSLYPDDPDLEVWSRNRPRDLEAWRDYVTALVQRYGQDVHDWQVWEQSDIHHFRGPDADLRLLLEGARDRLPAGDRLIAPEVGEINLGPIRRMIRHGLRFDVLGLYPDGLPPEGTVRPLAHLPPMQRWYSGVSNEATAALGLAHQVEVVFLEDWRNFDPKALVAPAASSVEKDYSTVPLVSIRLLETPDDAGLHLVHPAGLTGIGWQSDLAHGRTELPLDIDDTFLYDVDGHQPVDVDVEAQDNSGSLPLGFDVGYDGVNGYSFTRWQWVDAGPGWHHYVFRITDGEFADPRADVRINALGSKGDVTIRSVTVSRSAP
jgi:hypothetical protein